MPPYQTLVLISGIWLSLLLDLSSMGVETTSPIHHLIFGGGIVRGCTVLCVIDTYGHRWDTDKRSCFLCSEQFMFMPSCVACMKRMPVLQMSRQPLRSAAKISSWSEESLSMDCYLTLKIEIWTATGTNVTSRRATICKPEKTPLFSSGQWSNID